MIRVSESPAPADCHEARVPDLRKDHELPYLFGLVWVRALAG
jgi:hypothetical protein